MITKDLAKLNLKYLKAISITKIFSRNYIKTINPGFYNQRHKSNELGAQRYFFYGRFHPPGGSEKVNQ